MAQRKTYQLPSYDESKSEEVLSATRTAGIIIGILLALSRGTFALQEAGMLGGGSFMDNNATWIYIGSFLLLIGLLMILFLGFFRTSVKKVEAQT